MRSYLLILITILAVACQEESAKTEDAVSETTTAKPQASPIADSLSLRYTELGKLLDSLKSYKEKLLIELPKKVLTAPAQAFISNDSTAFSIYRGYYDHYEGIQGRVGDMYQKTARMQTRLLDAKGAVNKEAATQQAKILENQLRTMIPEITDEWIQWRMTYRAYLNACANGNYFFRPNV